MDLAGHPLRNKTWTEPQSRYKEIILYITISFSLFWLISRGESKRSAVPVCPNWRRAAADWEEASRGYLVKTEQQTAVRTSQFNNDREGKKTYWIIPQNEISIYLPNLILQTILATESR